MCVRVGEYGAARIRTRVAGGEGELLISCATRAALINVLGRPSS